MKSAVPILVAIFCATLFLHPTALQAQTSLPAWQLLTSNTEFSPRDSSDDFIFDGKLWLSNGWLMDGSVVRDLWSSVDASNWTLINAATPYDPYSQIVVFNGKLWAIRGSVWSSTDGVQWTLELATTPFGARSYPDVVVFNNKIWHIGGGADVWYSKDGVQWDCANPSAPFGSRRAADVIVFGNSMWLLGGSTGGANTPPEKTYPTITTWNDVWRSTDGVNWQRVLEHAPWAPRMWLRAQVYLGRMWILGGFDNVNGANFGDVWHSIDGFTWNRLVTETTFSPRHELSTYADDTSMWVVAGNSWPTVNDAWRLTISEWYPGDH
jgi:hypothetical protein